jgi:hypothetical protein
MTAQAPQDERDLRPIDQIFDVPHAQLASNAPIHDVFMHAACRA